MEPMIEIKETKKVYPTKRGSIHALGPVDLDVQEGDFISILGPSGCGKSTLLMMIAGLLDITSGNIKIAGNNVRGPQTDIGIIFQSPVLVDWRTVLGNVMLQIEMRKLDPDNFIARGKELLHSVGLEDFENCYPYELSGGMQQRTAFCRALVHDPPLILMDEPLGALDAMTRDQLRVDLERLWMRTKKTVIFVTHSIAESVQLSDKVVIFSPRPGMIDRVIDINLPHPRTIDIRESKEFQKYIHEITDIFMGYGILNEDQKSNSG